MRKLTMLGCGLALVVASSVAANDIAVTVYNSNLGVVSETRQLEFEKGVNRLAFRDVPAQIDPASVRFELVNDAATVTILEQNFAFDLVNAQQMYNKYIDKDIDLTDKDGNVTSGTLLSQSGNSVIIRETGGRIKILSLDNTAAVDFPVLPDGLITRPTLFWLYHSDRSGDLDGRVSYQTSGLTWDAEYVGLLDKTETGLDLSGWASINNTSGKTYEDATLKLVAGDINRATSGRGGRPVPLKAAMDFEAAGGFQEKQFFEYHMYTLPRKATVANREIKQISLFEPASTTVEKQFIFQPEQNPTQVKVALRFVNAEKAGLGMPLPEGRVRLFQEDVDGSLILLGEDRIEHTPRDEEVKLSVGYAFDIAAEEHQVRAVRISDKVQDREFEIELRNRKKEAVTVVVEKKLYGFWEMTQSSLDYEKKDAQTVEFRVPVKAGETAKLSFTVRFTS